MHGCLPVFLTDRHVTIDPQRMVSIKCIFLLCLRLTLKLTKSVTNSVVTVLLLLFMCRSHLILHCDWCGGRSFPCTGGGCHHHLHHGLQGKNHPKEEEDIL